MLFFDHALQRALQANLQQKLAYIPRQVKHMRLQLLGQTTLIDSGLNDDTFNTVFGGPISSTLCKSIHQYFAPSHRAMAWWVAPQFQSHVADRYGCKKAFP